MKVKANTGTDLSDRMLQEVKAGQQLESLRFSYILQRWSRFALLFYKAPQRLMSGWMFCAKLRTVSPRQHRTVQTRSAKSRFMENVQSNPKAFKVIRMTIYEFWNEIMSDNLCFSG